MYAVRNMINAIPINDAFVSVSFILNTTVKRINRASYPLSLGCQIDLARFWPQKVIANNIMENKIVPMINPNNEVRFLIMSKDNVGY